MPKSCLKSIARQSRKVICFVFLDLCWNIAKHNEPCFASFQQSIDLLMYSECFIVSMQSQQSFSLFTLCLKIIYISIALYLQRRNPIPPLIRNTLIRGKIWRIIPKAIILYLAYTLSLLSIIYMLILILLLTLTNILTQNCDTLTITAIIPCQMYFRYDSTLNACLFASCYTQSPGNPLNQTDWNTCYTLCCPSFIIPKDPTFSSTLPCYQQFNSPPALVWVLGVIVASILFTVCIALPCCIDSKCLFYKLRVKLCRKDRHKQSQPIPIDKCQSEETRTKRQQQLLSSQAQKYTQKSYKNNCFQLNSFLHVCLLCKLPKPDCRLLCGHFYHSDCLIQVNGNRLCCKACKKMVKFPVYRYCHFCFNNYELKYSMSQLAFEYTCFSCLLV